MITFLFETMRAHADHEAIATDTEVTTYHHLLEHVAAWQERFAHACLPAGAVVSMDGHYDAQTLSLLLALTQHRTIIVPLARDAQPQHQAFCDIAQVEYHIRMMGAIPTIEPAGRQARHPLYGVLHERATSGLVLFSSGSTGASKAVVHDLHLLLKKFQHPRHCWRTLLFLGLDHIGGINTLLYTLANGGLAVVPADRSPSGVCQAIQQHRVELLPTSPTFLNFLLLAQAAQAYDLSSLRLITYGTEPMPQSTLDQIAQVFPAVKLQQTYGLSELGILRSQSRDSRSLWVRIGGEGYQTKVVDNRLWVKAESAMLGYLNAPSAFDAQGYFDTGDVVEVDGEWLRILGRASEEINVGGSKVFPAEVENVLLTIDNVEDAAVYAEPNPLTGQMVAATIKLHQDESAQHFKAKMRRVCKDRLSPYQIPARVRFTTDVLHSERFKRMRRAAAKQALSGH
jgi:acyl-CoA synthetase (AMP-forming)/AMP-acid ligase II